MLKHVKTALRLKTTAFDEELTTLIIACQMDLGLSGIAFSENNELIKTAVIFFCKANFGDNKNAQRWQKAYNNLKSSLMVSPKFKEV